MTSQASGPASSNRSAASSSAASCSIRPASLTGSPLQRLMMIQSAISTTASPAKMRFSQCDANTTNSTGRFRSGKETGSSLATKDGKQRGSVHLMMLMRIYEVVMSRWEEFLASRLWFMPAVIEIGRQYRRSDMSLSSVDRATATWVLPSTIKHSGIVTLTDSTRISLECGQAPYLECKCYLPSVRLSRRNIATTAVR